MDCSGVCNLEQLQSAWHQLYKLCWRRRFLGTTVCMLCQGEILALDSKAARLKLLESAARKQGVSSLIRTKACQLQDLQQQHPELVPEGGFDRVLVDAPCSGTGTLAKRADLRWQRRAEDLPALCTLQVKHCASLLHICCMMCLDEWLCLESLVTSTTLSLPSR